MNPYVILALCLGLVAARAAESSSSGAASQTVDQSKQAETKRPFGLAANDLGQVKILLGFYSAKTGAGKQEIQISGNGTVTLFYSKSDSDEHPASIRGTLPVDVVWRLLDFMEGMDFFGLDNELKSTQGQERPRARRIVQLTLPGREKNVTVEESSVYAVEQLIGAIRLAASIAVPEALNHRFFPNL